MKSDENLVKFDETWWNFIFHQILNLTKFDAEIWWKSDEISFFIRFKSHEICWKSDEIWWDLMTFHFSLDFKPHEI